MKEKEIPRDVFVMYSEPSPDLTIENAKKMFDEIETEKELAALFSVVENKAWWMADEEFDFGEGSEEHKKTIEKTTAWFSLADKLKNRIFDILKSEGVKIPDRGQIAVLESFMNRNGYQNGQGWWIKNDK